MFLEHETLGFVLKKEDRGEADQILLVYAKDFGKIRVLAKSIRKLSSKLKGAVQAISLSQIGFIQGKGHKVLTEAILQERFSGTRRNFLKMRLAVNFFAIFNNLVKFEESDKSLWRLLNDFIFGLEKAESSRTEILLFYYYFFWRLVEILGFKPEFDYCIFCRKESKEIFWSKEEQGIVCSACQNKLKTKPIKVSLPVLKTIRNFFNRPALTALKKAEIDRKINQSVIPDLKNFSQRYFNQIKA